MHHGDDYNQSAYTPGYVPAAYGDQLAGGYDALYPPDERDTDAAVDLIVELAQTGRAKSVLEFGIGTGRIALAVHHRGVQVAGIDSSSAMITALRKKSEGANIQVTLGDYVSARIAGPFSVVALVSNNVFDPRGAQAQLDLFSNAATHLEVGGYFVIEAFVLNDAARSGSWAVSPRYVGTDHVELQMMRFDIDDNSLERTLLHLQPDGPTFISVRDTYASPRELDLMAHVTGFQRMQRYENWRRDPFTASSERHISVYRRR